MMNTKAMHANPRAVMSAASSMPGESHLGWPMCCLPILRGGHMQLGCPGLDFLDLLSYKIRLVASAIGDVASGQNAGRS
jgi:hypothetical protein